MAGLGIAAGCLVCMGAAAVGVGALLAASSTAFTLLKRLGAAYLLGWACACARAFSRRVRWPAWCARRPVTQRCRSRSRYSWRLLDECAESQGGHLLPGLCAAVHCPGAGNKALAFAARCCSPSTPFRSMLWALAAAWLVRRVGAVQRGMLGSTALPACCS